jgi:hypothetical protein
MRVLVLGLVSERWAGIGIRGNKHCYMGPKERRRGGERGILGPCSGWMDTFAVGLGTPFSWP